jgi:hypothetical protein
VANRASGAFGPHALNILTYAFADKTNSLRDPGDERYISERPVARLERTFFGSFPYELILLAGVDRSLVSHL